jgi:hypothetical protein
VGDRQDGNGDGDPAATPGTRGGVRALVDVERRGLDAANALVERLIRAVDGDGGGGDGVGAGARPEDGPRRDDAGHDAVDVGRPDADGGRRVGTGPDAGVGAADEVVRLWVDLVRLGLDAFGHLLTPGMGVRGAESGHGARVDVPSGGADGMVRLRAPAEPVPGGDSGDGGAEDLAEGSAEVWLHNGSASPHDGVALHCGELRCSDGTALDAGSVRFEPPVVDLPARSSRGVVAWVGTGHPPGTYRGVVLAAGVPDAWLPIEVVVAPPPSGG